MESGELLLLSKIFSSNAPGRVEKFIRRINYLAEHGWTIHLVTPSEPGVDFEAHMKQLDDSVSLTVSTMLSTPVRSAYYTATYGDNSNVEEGSSTESNNSLFSITSTMSGLVTTTLTRLKPWILLPDSWVDWVPTAIKDAESIINSNDIDLLFTSCYPFTAHLVGLWLESKYEIPWIAEFRDPWMNNPLIGKSPVWKTICRRLEQRTVRAADQVVIHKGWFPDGKDYFISQHSVCAETVVELPYVGYDDRVFDSTQIDTKYEEFTVVHAGNFYGEDCSPETFLRALATLETSRYDTIRAQFLGSLAPKYQRLITELGLDDRVEYIGVVPYTEVPSYLKRAHVGLWVMGEKQRYESNVPSKAFDYIGAELPILGLVPPGACSDFINSNGIGVTASPHDLNAVVEALVELYEVHEAGASGIDVDPAEFSRSKSLAAMKSTIENVSSKGVVQ